MAEYMTKEEGREFGNAVKTLREKLETVGNESAEGKRYAEAIKVDIDKLAEKHDEMVASLAEDRKAAEELKDQLKDLEAKAAIMTAGGRGDVEAKDVLGFVGAWAKGDLSRFMESKESTALAIIDGYKSMDLSKVGDDAAKMAQMMEQKAATDILRSDIGEVGGFLCPPEYSSEVLRVQIERAPLRRYVRVRNVSAKTYKEWVRTGIPVATRRGETREDNQGASKFGEVDFSPQRMSHTTPITTDQMLFSAVEMAQYIMDDTALAFGVLEGQEFFNGAGIAANAGLGFTTDPNVPEYTTATTTLTFDDFRNIIGQMKSGYNPMFAFNRRTLAYLLTLKDDNGRYLWNPPYGDAAGGAPATIAGEPYSSAFIEFDDYNVSGGYPVLYADFMMFYQIVDRTDMNIIRDEFTRKREAIVEYTHNKWTYGAPRLKEAGIRMLRQA